MITERAQGHAYPEPAGWRGVAGLGGRQRTGRGRAVKYRKRPIIIEATQWLQNGDHPEDYPQRMVPAVDWCEGLVVRYYRHPGDSRERLCEHCGRIMHDHGWIDTKEGGHIVCPGDWIIRGVKGEFYPIKDPISQEGGEP